MTWRTALAVASWAPSPSRCCACSAVAFVPVRRKVQAVVDRRFNRSHHDARLVVEQFGVRLQHDHDIEVMARDLGAAVDATVQPAHVALWIRRRPEVR